MKEFNFDKAVKRYNDIMMSLCYEHVTIGTRYSEDTKGWNIRDMVAECDYVLSGYFESGHCNADMRYSDDPEERKIWRSETGRLQRFIAAFKPFIDGVICEAGHCSQYDNYKDRFKDVSDLIADASARATGSGAGSKQMDSLVKE